MENSLRYPDREMEKASSSQYVSFKLGNETYGIFILKLNEIISYQGCTPIPDVPRFIKGVINLRGVVVPVIDLRERFGMESISYDQLTVIMILDVSGRIMGLVVDAVNDVITLNRDEISPRPQFSTGISTDFIQGIGIKGSKFIILLDVDKLLTGDDLNMVDGV
jgi:purine-binding chemotaxis protein CheW